MIESDVLNELLDESPVFLVRYPGDLFVGHWLTIEDDGTGVVTAEVVPVRMTRDSDLVRISDVAWPRLTELAGIASQLQRRDHAEEE